MSGMEQKPLWRRLAWLVLLWSGSVLALAVVAGCCARRCRRPV